MSQNQNNNQTVNDAHSIISTFLNHINKTECPHCLAVLSAIKDNKQNVGEPARVPTQPEPTPYRTKVDLI